jgi:pimeloyl-ACP methyl ester carboxylesterase
MQPTLRTVRLPSGMRLEIAQQGDEGGLPVLMLHGITDSWRSFQTVMAHLPPSLRVVSASQRGHGESDRPRQYRTRHFADDAASLIETLGLGRALVVGHSMGTVNAMRLAIDRPDLVRGLVLAAAFAGFRHNAGIVEFNRDAVAPLRDPVDRAFIEEWQRSTLARPIDAAYFEAIVDETTRVPASVWHGAFAGMLEDDFVAEVHRITVPTLLAWGDRDAFCPRADQQSLLHAISGSRLVTYADAGHALHWEEPKRFADDVAAFAKEIAAATVAGAR